MKTNYLPAIIMLCAGFVDCLMAIKNHLSLQDFTIELLAVLVIFYVVGIVVKIVLDRGFKVMESEENPDDVDGEQETDEEKAAAELEAAEAEVEE